MRRLALGIMIVVLLLAGCGNESSPKITIINHFDIFKGDHPEEEIIYSATVDLDNDNILDYFIITSKEDPKLWCYFDKWVEVLDMSQAVDEYQETLIIERGEDKHLAILGSYLPSNAQLWVYKKENEKLVQEFAMTSDYGINIIPKGFRILNKQYMQDGGLKDISKMDFFWNENLNKYQDEYEFSKYEYLNQ